jgi:hypothetical protein
VSQSFNAGLTATTISAGTLTVTGNPTNLQYVIINNDLDLFNSQVETNNYGTYGRLRLFRASGSQASPTTPSSGSAVGRLEFGAWNSATSTFIANAKIEASMDATSGGNDLPSRLTFFTTPDGSTTMTERMRINSAGRMRIGGVAMSLSDVINVEGGSVAFQNGYGLRFQSTGGTMYAGVYSNDNDTVIKSLGNAIRFKNRSGSSNLMSILDNGFVGVNNDTPTEYLHVNGNTLINGGFTADTISATTYLNLPLDIRVTGGTYSSGTTVFVDNTGGTFSVTGFSTGSFSSVSGNMVNTIIPSAPVVQNTSTSVFSYSLSTSILSANTGTIAGAIRLNNLNFSGVTQIYINENSLNESAYYYLADLKIGDDVQIQTENNLSLTRYKISGTPIDNGSYFTLPVTFKSSIGLKPLSTSTVLVSLNIYGDTISLPVDSRAQKLNYLANDFITPNDFVYYPSVYTLKQALLSEVLNPTRTLQQVVVAGQEADRVNFKHYYWNLTPYPTNFMLELQNGTYFIASNSGPYYWLSNNGSALTG